MAIIKKNNIRQTITTDMSSVSNLLVVDKGNLLGEDFTGDPTKNFKLTLFKFDGELVSQIEVVRVIAKTGNFLTIERCIEPCPLNYTTDELIQQAYDFHAGDVAYMNLTAGDIDEILEMIEDTNGRIDDVETDYLTKQEFEDEKGSPGGIATLDENSKIPGAQINVTTLEVNALNSEFVAGEDITAGEVVALGHESEYYHPWTENGGSWSYTSAYKELTTIELTGEPIIYFKYDFNISSFSNMTTTYANSHRSEITIRSGSATSATTYYSSGYFYPVVGDNTFFLKLAKQTDYTGTATVYLRSYFNSSPSPSAGTNYGQIYYPTSYFRSIKSNTLMGLVKNYDTAIIPELGIANDTKAKGEPISVSVSGIYGGYSGLEQGATYGIERENIVKVDTFTSNLNYIGKAISTDKLLISKEFKKSFYVQYGPDSDGENTKTITFYHNLGTIPNKVRLFRKTNRSSTDAYGTTTNSVYHYYWMKVNNNDFYFSYQSVNDSSSLTTPAFPISFGNATNSTIDVIFPKVGGQTTKITIKYTYYLVFFN